MASSRDYLEYVLERLSAVCDDVSYRPMMGEFLVYKDGVYFGGVFDDRLLVKPTDSVKGFGMEEQLPYDGANPMFLVDAIDDNELAKNIVVAVVDDLKKSPKKKK